MDWTLSGATTSSQSGPGSDGSKGIHRIPQSSSITGNLTIKLFSVISGNTSEEFYPSTEMQSVYSTAPSDWAFLL